MALVAGIALRQGPPSPTRAPGTAEEATAKPNIVVVMTDDQTLEQMSALPRTRKLIGTQGVKFKRFYVTDPLCCPSRATFLTGQYAHNTGVISNGGPNGARRLRRAKTLGVWLQRAGYRTAFVGKYLNGYGLEDPERVPPGWSEWRALLEPTTQSYFDYELNEDGAVTSVATRPRTTRPASSATSRSTRSATPLTAIARSSLPRLQRAARTEHAGAPRPRVARRA